MAQRKLPKEYTDYIAKVLWYLRREILHGEYDMKVRYVEKLESHNDSTTTAEIGVDAVYLNFRVIVSAYVLDLWKQKKYREIAKILMHEICHLLTEPLKVLVLCDATPSQSWLFKEINERQTQRIANILDVLLPANWYEPAKLSKLLRDDAVTSSEA